MTRVSIPHYQVNLKCSLYKGVEKIGQVVSDLQKLNSRDFERKSVKGKKVWRIDYHIEAKLGNEEGVLCFRTICNGKEYGNTEINYTD